MTTANPYFPVPVPDQFGPMYGSDDVRDAVKAVVDEWAPFYTAILSQRLATAGRIGGPKQNPNPLPSFGQWTNEPNFRNIGTGKPASYVVTCAGTVGTPERQGSGLYIATFRAEVVVRVFGTTWQDAADLTSWYEKVVRWCVMQHRKLNGIAQGTRWAGSRYAEAEHSSTRTLGSAVLGFDVRVPSVLDDTRGLSTLPLTTKPGQDETVEDVILELSKVPVNEPI